MQKLKGSVSRGVVSQRKCPTVTLEPMFARGAWVFCPSLRRVIKIQTANLSAGCRPYNRHSTIHRCHPG